MKKKNILTIAILIAILVLVAIGFIYFNTNAGKAFIQRKAGVYKDNIDKTYLTNSVMLWKPNQNGILNGAALSGEVSGDGTVRAYLVNGKNLYLMMELRLENETTTFTNVCNETCNLQGFTANKYLLRFEVPEFTTIKINSITYGIGQGINQSKAVIETTSLNPTQQES